MLNLDAVFTDALTLERAAAPVRLREIAATLTELLELEEQATERDEAVVADLRAGAQLVRRLAVEPEQDEPEPEPEPWKLSSTVAVLAVICYAVVLVGVSQPVPEAVFQAAVYGSAILGFGSMALRDRGL